MEIYKDKYIKFLKGLPRINTIHESPRTDRIETKYETHPFNIVVDITRAPDGCKVETKIYLINLLIEEDVSSYGHSNMSIEELIDVSERFCDGQLKFFCNGIKKWMEFEIK